jgi:hypothetical protein
MRLLESLSRLLSFRDWHESQLTERCLERSTSLVNEI